MTILPDARGRDPHRCRRREGKTLVMFALLLPVLLGVTGLVIDSGMLMAAQRQAQNAADAAALAAAMDMYKGSAATATATANTFMASNGLSGVTLALNAGTTNAVNIPPTTGPHAGSPQYAEAYVTKPVTTSFIQVLGVNKSQQVTARAVAGYEPVGAGEGVFVLDPTASPGLSINTNNTRLVVNGDITVNSLGGGVDQYGVTVTSSLNSDAVKVSNSTTTPAPIVATTLNVSGGVTNLDNIRAYDPAFGPTNMYDPANTDRPVLARVPNAPDPLKDLETPTTSSVGTPVINRNLGSPSINNSNQTGLVAPNAYNSTTQTTTLYPGIYSSISIGGGTVVLQPGIYVLASGATNTLKVTGGSLSGNGVMFYNTGSDYNPTAGTPDKTDGSTTPAKNNGIGGAFQITGGSINLYPLNDANSPFNGLLFYQRRFNMNTASISGSSGSLNFQGTLYAKWALFQLSGQGSFNAQFLVGSMAVGGGATVTINATGKNLGMANLVFLVE